MKEKKWTFTIVDSAEAVADFLSEKNLGPSDVHVVLASHDKFYVFHLN